MRITHVITRLIVGGAQENTIASVLGLRQKPGLDVNLLSGPSIGPEGSLESNLTPFPGVLAVVPSLVRPVHPWKDWLARRALENIFQQTKPDVVHTHSGKAGVLGRLAAASAGVPIIVHTIHGPSFGKFQGQIANTVFRAAERKAARVTSHFVSVANAMTEQYLAAGIGRPDQYSTIFSGFNLKPLLSIPSTSQLQSTPLRAQWGLKPDDIVIGKIARLFKLKGHDDLFAVAPSLLRRCPRIKFLLVGDGEWRGRFEDRVRELGVQDAFVFTGLVRPDEIPNLIGIMDILVHLSLREGLARALPQALAAARPVVAYDCDGAKEVCIDGESGFLLPPGDLPALENRLVQLAEQSGLRDQFGRRGRELVKDRFTVERMVDDLHGLYQQLARARGIRVP
jgi:glycosyltransferase involved in cell wall biosynthesis